MIYEKELASYGGSTHEAAEIASKIIDVSVDRVYFIVLNTYLNVIFL